MRTALRLWLVAAGIGILAACAADAPVASPLELCRTEPGAEAGLRVNALSDAYFYADAPGGDQEGYALGGSLVSLEPGEYVARLNDTRHPVTVEEGQVTVCEAATIEVAGTTAEYWYLVDSVGTQLGYALLGQPLAVFPGSYTVRVNNTRTRVEAEARNVSTPSTGTVVVAGTTSEYFYVLDENGEQLAYSTLGQPISLLPGSYRVRVNNSHAPFSVEPGRATTLTAGTVVATGTTAEYYYVHDAAGEQLGYAVLGEPTSYLPGSYSLRVNNRTTPIVVAAKDSTVVPTGTVVMEGPAGEYFYVLTEDGQQLGYSTMGTPLSLLPGTYRIRVGDRTETVTVAASEKTAP
jgi:hypothetical protein